MNLIAAFFSERLAVVFFVYGLALFALGLVLATSRRRRSEFRFLAAITPLAAFGLLHGAHEWLEMFQLIEVSVDAAYAPPVWLEILRVALLATSFLCLLAFSMLLLSPEPVEGRRLLLPLAALTLLWLGSVLIAGLILNPAPIELTAYADVLSRYSLAIPGALLGAWALMRQQRTFREHEMPQFGRYLVWAAAALLLYGVVGQTFVRETPLFPSNVLNAKQFMAWFGVPVQLFRAVLAVTIAYFIIRALDIFEVETKRRLEEANQIALQAQAAKLESERRNLKEMERLNEELRQSAHELALLLYLSNLLVSPRTLEERLHELLVRLVQELVFCDSGVVLLVEPTDARLTPAASVGFGMSRDETPCLACQDAIELGKLCIENGIAMCRHADGMVIEFHPETALARQECQAYVSPMVLLALPLKVQARSIGSLVFGRRQLAHLEEMSYAEFKLILAVAQTLGLSLEHARLADEAEDRKRVLGELLHQAVGAQEAERQRIARELHDATGQSLTAISLGLRAVESALAQTEHPAEKPVHELGLMSARALGELRQIIADLRPAHLDDLGLAPAIRWYLKQYEERRAIHTQLTVSGEPQRLPPEAETLLFRIMQEALTNITKHAQATEARVSLQRYNATVVLCIEDNGRGFDVASVMKRKQSYEGLGLLGMQERASLLGGRIDIRSAPGQGTCIEVTIPVERES